MDDEQQLRQASDGFLARLDQLRRLEHRKREAVPGTRVMVALAAEVTILTRHVLEWAERQEVLATLAAKRQPTELRPIAIVPPRDLQVVLSDWREAERAFEAAPPGSAAWETARADVERFRDEYARAYAMRES